MVFWLGALAAGLAGAGFAAICNQAQFAFASLTGDEGWRRFLPLLVTPAGFIFCAFMADRYFPGSQGNQPCRSAPRWCSKPVAWAA